jgi:hypothetical protein
MKRLIWIAVVLIAGAGAAAQYFDAEFARPRIERALERGLGRRVEVGKVYFNLFTGPGFTVQDVTIYDDPRVGIEPFAYVPRLEARVNPIALFRRKLEFSSLRLDQSVDDKTDINLVKTAAGPWNFQLLLGSAPALSGSMPAIKMRTGRVNFKFADTKSVFYLSDADFDVSPSDDGSVELRLSGAPSRTDQAAPSFGHFFLRGKWNRETLDMRVELERSALEEVALLLDQHGFGLHGVIALDAQLSGAPSNLAVTGRLQIDDVHRSDLLPRRGGAWSAAYRGTLDLRGERLELETADDPAGPLALRFRAWDFLGSPHWDAGANLKQVPLNALMDVARRMGAELPEKLSAEGSVSGEATYAEEQGLNGHVQLHDASVALPDARPLRAASAEVAIAGRTLSLDSATVHIGDEETADLEGSFTPDEGLDLKITTRALSVADLRSFGLAAIPLLEQTPQGTWRGWARYQWSPGAAGAWSGEYELQNARIAIDGLADPLRIQTASVTSSGARVAVNRIRAKIGAIAFTGDYRWEPAAIRPHKFRIAIPEADAAELERLWSPVLVRERGFLARTLSFGAAPVPDWLKARRADGTIAIDQLTIGDSKASVNSARLLWDGSQVRLAGLDATLDDARITGELTIDLAGRAPRYRFDGKAQNVAYKGGALDFDGSLATEGTGVDLIASARAEGSLRGQSIAFNPDADFRTVAACFELLPGVRWKISCLEVSQGPDLYTGSGATQADGRLVLDLTGRGKQVRYSAAAATPAP